MSDNTNDHEALPLPLPGKLSQPAQRALTGSGIAHLEQLTRVTEAEVKRLHGIGPSALKQLREALNAHGLSFAINKEAEE